jgi:hypothetical protein
MAGGAAKVNDLQNKLGFLTSVARRLAQNLGKRDTATLLRDKESVLERSRLIREDTLCHESLSQAEGTWLRSNRSKEAKHWHLLTDLSPKHLSLSKTITEPWLSFLSDTDERLTANSADPG